MQSKAQIDQVLRQKSDAKEIPGVVAMAATGKEVIYQGAFGKRDLSKDDAMTADSVFWIASMTKAITSAAAHATGRAGQALARCADRQGAAGSRRTPGARRLRRQRRAEAAAGEEADHAAPSHDPHRRLLLRHVERRHGEISGEDRHARHHHLPERRAEDAAHDRSRHALGIRHQHRFRRQGGRSRERQAARCLSARPSVRAARHDRHRLQDRRRASASGWSACTRAARTDRWRRSRSNSSRIRNSTWVAAASTAPRATTSSSPR